MVGVSVSGVYYPNNNKKNINTYLLYGTDNFFLHVFILLNLALLNRQSIESSPRIRKY